MMQNTMRAVALATLTILMPAVASAAKTPAPRPMPTPRLPDTTLHTEFVVEVNKMGQIVRVKSGKSCKNLTFNAQTYGNVLQMWIRHPDGSAEVGLYRVTYDYNPKTHDVARNVSLLKAGGNWANEEGAANNMVDIARRQNDKTAAEQSTKKKQQEQAAKNLPDINAIIKKDVVKPSASPQP